MNQMTGKVICRGAPTACWLLHVAGPSPVFRHTGPVNMEPVKIRRTRATMTHSGPMVSRIRGVDVQTHGTERRQSMNRLAKVEGDPS